MDLGDRSRRSLASLVAGLALAGLLIAAAAPPALATPGWTGPVSLGTASYWSARLGVDGDGKLHVVALDDEGLLYRTNKGGSWHTTRLWNEAFPNQDDLDVRVDRSGNVFVAWSRGCDCDDATSIGILYLTNAFGGPNHGWPSTPTMIVSGPAYEPSLRLVDFKVHLAYRKGTRIHYTTNATRSGAWAHAVVSPKGTRASDPSLVVHPATRARIAYASGDRIVLAVNTGTAAAPVFTREVIPGAVGSTPSLALDRHLRPSVAWAYQRPTCAAGAGEACVATAIGAAPEEGTFLVRKGSSGWSAIAARRRVSRVASSPQLLLDGAGRFHLFDGVHVITNASGAIERPVVVTSFINDTASLALTVGGKARVIYLDDADDTGDVQALFLMKER